MSCSITKESKEPKLQSVPEQLHFQSRFGLRLVAHVERQAWRSTHYDVFLPLFESQAVLQQALRPERDQLIFTDTDSFEYHVKIDNLAEFTRKLLSIRDEWLDTSNYPESHPLYSKQNKKKLGYFKNEHPGEAICEAVALRSKVHAEISRSGSERRLKGIARAAVEKT